MSYDLAVFEKDKVKSGFLNWYDNQMDEEGVKLTETSENMQKFFHSLRRVFPPMNGEFSPSDEELSQIPDLEKKLCEYDIKKDMISLSFSFSVSEMAKEIVKRAAYFCGLGFFNPSENEEPVLFDSRIPMRLEGEGFRPYKINGFVEISGRLKDMNDPKHSFLCVTDPVGNYIQAGGYGESFSVEKRLFTDIMDYVHYKAEHSNAASENKNGIVSIFGNIVKLDQEQIFSKEQTGMLFKDFFENTNTFGSVKWTEMDI